MDTLFYYLLKSAVWLFSFAAIYFVFLRNERFFELNRFFLVLGIFSALVFPVITMKYMVVNSGVGLHLIESSEKIVSSSTSETITFFLLQKIILIGYALGVVFFFTRAIWQISRVLSFISSSNIKTTEIESYRLIQTEKVKSSFSFFIYIFINPSVDKIEKQEIINHELGHINQKHWFDLLLFEILLIIQWFNPVVWLYGHLIRQNHEYLADKYALKYTVSSVVYKATLLNRLMGGSVVTLTNSFNYSLNQKRFKMMNYNKQSSIRKFKLALIIPVIAFVFLAFSEPNYVQEESVVNTTNSLNEINTDQLADTISKIKVGNISWENNNVFSSRELTKKLGFKSGDVLTDEEVSDKLYTSVNDLYFDKGYVFVHVKVNKSLNQKGSTDFVFDLIEGQKSYFGNITFKGNNKSNEELERIVATKEGAVFTRIDLVKSIEALSSYLNISADHIIPNVTPNKNEHTIDVVFNLD